MSYEMSLFIAEAIKDPALQEKLCTTKNISDVASIAQTKGFKITGAQILRAQAGRVLMLPAEQLEKIVIGEKSISGVRWGRFGTGYLENAGFWISKFMHWGYADTPFEPKLEAFFSKVEQEEVLQTELLIAKTFKDVATMANKYGFDFSGSQLLRYFAIQILQLTDDKAEKIARGKT